MVGGARIAVNGRDGAHRWPFAAKAACRRPQSDPRAGRDAPAAWRRWPDSGCRGAPPGGRLTSWRGDSESPTARRPGARGQTGGRHEDLPRYGERERAEGGHRDGPPRRRHHQPVAGREGEAVVPRPGRRDLPDRRRPREPRGGRHRHRRHGAAGAGAGQDRPERRREAADDGRGPEGPPDPPGRGAPDEPDALLLGEPGAARRRRAERRTSARSSGGSTTSRTSGWT